MVYGDLAGYTSTIWPTGQVSELPIVVTYEEGTTTYTDTWSALVTLGNIKIDFVDNVNLYNGISNAHEFRYVIIPGAALAAARRLNINFNDYNAVKSFYKLRD